MSQMTVLSEEIDKRYGTIKRARGCFLYTKKGIRLTDLYQEGGKAILGWGGTSFTVFKNVLNRGLTGSYTTDYVAQVKKAVSVLLASNRSIGMYVNKQVALKVALAASAENTSVWRPWNPEEIDWSSVASVVMEPPFPWCSGLWIVALTPAPESDAALAMHISDTFPAPVLAGVARSMYNMVAALQERKETDWFIYDTVVTKYWQRKGPYLYPTVSRENYGDFVRHCLDCHLVISPDYDTPSIVPFGADVSVFKLLKNNPFGA